VFSGWTAEIKTPADLLRKLEHDRDRMRADPVDVYAAFDFFVTAEHLPDWDGDLTIKQGEPLLRITSHLANGAKHFRATDRRHKSVRDVRVEAGAFDPDTFQHDVFDVGSLVVDLDGDEAAAFGPSMGIPELADQVLEFWRLRV
jgi:hypothetical protein